MSFRPRLGYPILFVLVALAIVAPLAFLLVAAYGDLHRQAETSARNVVNVLEARLEATLRRAQAGLEELAAETPLEALESAVSPALQRQVQLQLALRARHFPEITGFRLIDREGVVRFASEIESPRANALGRSYFESLRKDPTQSLVFSEVAVGRMAGRQQLYMATPIRDAHGGFAGVAMAPLELNYVQALFDAVDLGPGGASPFGAPMTVASCCAVRPSPTGSIGPSAITPCTCASRPASGRAPSATRPPSTRWSGFMPTSG